MCITCTLPNCNVNLMLYFYSTSCVPALGVEKLKLSFSEIYNSDIPETQYFTESYRATKIKSTYI